MALSWQLHCLCSPPQGHAHMRAHTHSYHPTSPISAHTHTAVTRPPQLPTLPRPQPCGSTFHQPLLPHTCLPWSTHKISDMRVCHRLDRRVCHRHDRRVCHRHDMHSPSGTQTRGPCAPNSKRLIFTGPYTTSMHVREPLCMSFSVACEQENKEQCSL